MKEIIGKPKILSILLMVSTLFFTSIYAADGDLDPSFGGDGKVITVVPGHTSARITGMYIQADGNIVVVGYNDPFFTSNFIVARYLPNGSLDASFAGGIAIISLLPLGFTAVEATGVAVQSDGKIVVVGSATGSIILGQQRQITGQMFVARLNANGTLDTSFNAGGLVPGIVIIPTFEEFSNDAANAVVIDVDQSIVVAGSSNSSMAVARLNTDGSLDTSFNGTGQLIIQFAPGSIDAAFAVALEGDGKTIIVAGYSNAGESGAGVGNRNFAFARINPGGTVDITRVALFSTDPEELETIATEAHAVLVQPDGKIVLVGFTDWLDNAQYFALARYLPNGNLDPAFTSAPPSISLNPGTFISPSDAPVFTEGSTAFAAALQADGKIIAAGSGPNTSELSPTFERYHFGMLARYLPADGALDTSFNGGVGAPPGFVWTSFRTPNIEDEFLAVALQQNGNIVAAGYSENGSFAQSDFALARYLVDSPPVPLTPTLFISPTPNQVFGNGIINFNGTAQNPSIIDIYVDGTYIGATVTVGASNTWSFTNTIPFTPGVYNARAVARYRDDGHVNLESTVLFVVFQSCDLVANDLLLLACANTPLNDTLANSVTGGVPPYTFAQLGAALNGTVQINPNGSFVFTPDPLFLGVGSFQYLVTDAQQPPCTAVGSVSIDVESCCPLPLPSSFLAQLFELIPG